MSYRILLVDDEPDILEFISYNLNKEGYTVYTASNGREAVQKALEVIPHVILLDVMMPEMDGIETCQEIRTHPELAATMIAFLTARSEDYSQIAGFDAGADDYITKPIRVKVLVSRIKALLKRVEGTQSAPGRALQMDRERYLVVIPLGNPDTLGESPHRFRRISFPAQSADRRHPGIVPTHNNLILNKL